jgi:hypothetical protein
MKKEAIRVSSMVPTAPTTLYLDWLQSDQHGSMIGSTAKVDPQVGGKFSALNGSVSGKLLALDLGRRIVMSWRSTAFPKDAADSRVELTLEAIGGSSRVTVLQTEIPEGLSAACKELWEGRYFAPMRSFFSKYLPDPRKPPPPRPPPRVEVEDEQDEQDEEEDEAPPARSAKPVKGGSAKTNRAVAKPTLASATSAAKPSAPAQKNKTKPATSKKADPQKPAQKKPAPKKVVPQKPAPKKAVPQKPAPKKPAPKKPAPKKAPKPAPKKKR